MYTRMNNNKINIIFEDFDKNHVIVFLEKNGKDMSFIFAIYEFLNEMEYWDLPTKLESHNGKLGFVFAKNIDRTILELEIKCFIKQYDLDNKDASF